MQNARITTFTVSELRETQLGREGELAPPRPNTLIKTGALLDYIRLFIFSKKVYNNNIKLNLTNK